MSFAKGATAKCQLPPLEITFNCRGCPCCLVTSLLAHADAFPHPLLLPCKCTDHGNVLIKPCRVQEASSLSPVTRALGNDSHHLPFLQGLTAGTPAPEGGRPEHSRLTPSQVSHSTLPQSQWAHAVSMPQGAFLGHFPIGVNLVTAPHL